MNTRKAQQLALHNQATGIAPPRTTAELTAQLTAAISRSSSSSSAPSSSSLGSLHGRSSQLNVMPSGFPVSFSEKAQKLTGKRGKLAAALGEFQLTDEQAAMLLAHKSVNADLAQAAAKERMDDQLDFWEKKEAFETQMTEVEQISVKAFKCLKCNDVTEVFPKGCKDKGHAIATIQSVRRYWECKKCCNRGMNVGARFMKASCKKCGSSEWGKVRHLCMSVCPPR